MRKKLKKVPFTKEKDINIQQQNNNRSQILKLQEELRTLKGEIHIYDLAIARMREEMSKTTSNRHIQTAKYYKSIKKLTSLLLEEAGLSHLSSGCGGDST